MLRQSNASQGDLLMAAKARRQAHRSRVPQQEAMSTLMMSNTGSSDCATACGHDALTMPSMGFDTTSVLTQQAHVGAAASRSAVDVESSADTSLFGGLLSAFSSTPEQGSCITRSHTLDDEEPVEAAATRSDSRLPLKERPVVIGQASALCFAGGFADLPTACALACVDISTHRTLAPWLRQLRAGKVHADEPLHRLRAAAHAAQALPCLTELFVDDERRLDVRWLTGKSTSAATRNVLDLVASLNGGARWTSNPKPPGAFAVTFVGAMLARDGAALRRIVPWPATEVNLFARKLDLSARGLGDTGVAAVAGALAGAYLPNLREVVLTSNKLGDAGTVMLAKAIASGNLSRLRTLLLGDNRIGPHGVRSLAAATRHDGGEGGESSTDADEDGPAIIVLSCRHPLNALATLNLEGNHLGDQGLALLAAPLAEGTLPSLEVLVLNRNDITDLSPLTVALARGESPHLRRLLLQRNPIAEASLRELQATVGTSKPRPFADSSRSGSGWGATPNASAATQVRGAEPTGVAVRVRGVFDRGSAVSGSVWGSDARGRALPRLARGASGGRRGIAPSLPDSGRLRTTAARDSVRV